MTEQTRPIQIPALLLAEVRNKPIDVQQVIYALERQMQALALQAEKLSDQRDYSAEFPYEDAQRMREAIELLQKSLPTDAGGEPERWLIQFNDDGEFGQATGWLYRDGGHPCSVTGQPVFVWSKLNELLAKTGHVIVRVAAHEVIGVEKVSALLNIEDPNIAIEPLTWHIVPGPKLPDADATVLCQLEADDEDCWPGYYDGERWMSAEGFPFASRVVAWSQPRGVKP